MVLPWIDLNDFGYVRLSTILTATVLLSIIIWRTRKPWIAVLAILAWASLYEIIYQVTGCVMHQQTCNMPWSKTVWMSLALIAWPILAHRQGIRLNRWVILAFAGIWLIWVSLGFHSNSPDWKAFVARDELLNVLSKATLALAYLWASIQSRYASHTTTKLENLSGAKRKPKKLSMTLE